MLYRPPADRATVRDRGLGRGQDIAPIPGTKRIKQLDDNLVRLAEQHSGPVHLLLTDVAMPEMGSRQLVEHLARLRPHLRVLYLSGYTEDAVVRHGILQGTSPSCRSRSRWRR